LLGVCQVDGMWPVPPTISNFFQHPWSIGLPLALCILIVLSDREAPASPWRAVVYALCFLSLALTQFVLFVTVTATVLASECWHAGSIRKERCFPAVAAAAIAGAGALWMGGFFLPSPESARGALTLTVGVRPSLGGTIAWNFQSFGLLLPIGAAGILLLRRERLTLALLAGGSFAVVNAVAYEHSWDSAKFGMVCLIGLALAAPATVRMAWTLKNRLAAALIGGGLVLAAVCGGVLFWAILAAGVEGIPPSVYHPAISLPPEEDRQAIRWLRDRIAAGEMVYRNPRAAFDYARWGGLPVPWMDTMTSAHGVGRERLERRSRFLSATPAAVGPWLEMNLVWIVISPDDGPLAQAADRWVREGSAAVEARFGNLAILRLRT
jgi:hypothetical protein